MALDALCLNAVLQELKGLVGSRVDRIQQPERDVLLFSLRSPNGNCKLLLSAGSGSARVHLTTFSRENPAEPPMFCMLLRKHLGGARLIGLEQPENERLYLLHFSCLDELGESSEKTLAVEMLGRASNFVLIDAEGRILDCLRKIDSSQSEKRQLLPGLFYRLPPKPTKPLFFEQSPEDLERLFSDADPDRPGDLWLSAQFGGLSPLLARELVSLAAGDSAAPVSSLSPASLLAAAERLRTPPFEPVLLRRSAVPADVWCRRLTQYGPSAEQEVFESFSELLDFFYTEKEKQERQNQRSQSMVKLVRHRRDRAAKKLTLRTEEQSATAQRETWRQWGDLIKANLYRMHRGDRELTADNFYTEDCSPVTIPLDIRLSPQQNAAKYYKLYTKAKNAEKILAAQIAEAEEELAYLESVLEELSLAGGEKDLSEIRQELAAQGYIRENTAARKKKLPAPQPMKYRSSTGVPIYVGKNNTQNDWLTLRFADKRSLWFHTRKTHGSHVVADCDESDAQTMKEAAMLAAWYSKARDSSSVPVDFTRVKNVKKPSGAKPGMVIYTDYRTLYVTPEESELNRLRKG